ncbi:hypothetical protein T06_9486 [Trichinella sp. T6]|nr:hypothetical protein T06_9486 [Trichinella sp. T6]
MEMPVTGILQSHNRTPKCFSLLKSCRAVMFQHDIGKLLLASTSDPEEEEVSISLATPSAARLLLYSYLQRNMYKIIQRNIWEECG